MRFFVRKRRATPTIIIVALIDVLIVLLIFLMVTTNFKQQAAIPIALPESTESKKAGANENAPMIVSIDAKGTILIGADALPVTEERLKEELLAGAKKNPELKLAINADENAPWGKIVKVRNAAQAAKIKYLFAFTKEPAKP